MDWINAHRKGLLAVLAAVLVLFVDEETAQSIVAVIGALLVYIVPNDQDAVNRVYYKGEYRDADYRR